MDPQLFRQIGEVFEAARSLDPEKRRRYLDAACASRPDVRAEVEAILEHDHPAAGGVDDSLLRQGCDLREGLLGSAGGASESFPEGELRRVGRYRITGKIARGGMGSILRADDDMIGREIAVKVLLESYSGNELARRRFVEEGQISGQLQHPGIVPVHELGKTDDHRPFLAMKLVKGQTFAELLRDRTGLPAERRRHLHVFEHACQAIAYAHSRGIIHRDLKPLNIMVGAFGEVQVMDWGLAKVLERPESSQTETAEREGGGNADRSIRTLRRDSGDALSLPGRVMGTPAYMAPEQARAESDRIDKRADVFGLGAILCEILTGAPPYIGKTTAETVRQAREGDTAEALRRIASSDADPDLVQIATRCLELRPEDRYPDAGELSAELGGYLQSVEERARNALLEATEAKVRAEGERKARKLTTTFGLLFAVVLLAGFGIYLGMERQRRERVRVAEAGLRRGLLQAEKLRAEAQLLGAKAPSKWEAALVAATRTRDLVSDETDPRLGADVDRLVSGLERKLRTVDFLAKLEAVSLGQNALDALNNAPAEAAYRDAFREFLEEDALELDPDKAAAQIVASGFATEISMSLDDWTLLARKRDPESRTWRRIQELACRVDPDPWRNELRRTIADRGAEPLQRLAGSKEVETAPARSLLLLAQGLLFGGRIRRAVEVLRRSRERFPDDFHTNYNLGLCLLTLDDRASASEALQYFTAADALRPRSALIQGSLAACHLRLGDPETARILSEKALALAPDEPFALLNHGDSLRALGDLEGAEAAYSRALDLSPENYASYGDVALRLAGAVLRMGRADEAAPLYAKALRMTTASARSLDYALADRIMGPKLFRATEAWVARTRRTDPDALFLLAVLLERRGLERDAIITLEEVLQRDPKHPQARRRLERARASRTGMFASFASIDAAVDALPHDIDFARSREKFQDFLEKKDDAEAAARRRYLAARLCQRASRREEAIELLREVLRAERRFPEPFVRLYENLEASRGASQARTAFRATLQETGLPPVPFPVPPRRPEIVAPLEGDARPLTVSKLRASAFEHLDPRETHIATRWMIRRDAGDYDLNPVLDVLSRAHLTEFELPPGLLVAGIRYGFRVAYVASNGRISGWCKEAFFTAPPDGPTPVSFDLSPSFNRDVVANPGDPVDDAFDVKNDYRLLVNQYGGVLASLLSQEQLHSLRGLPPDGRIGVHRLGGYDEPNTVQLGPTDEAEVRIDVPRGRYVCVRLVVSGSNGDSIVPLRAEFADGGNEKMQIYCDDWFDDIPDGEIRLDGPSWPLWNGMDRMGRRAPESRDDPALFEVLLALPADRELTALVLQPAGGRYREEAGRFHLFAVTGMKP